MDQDTLHSLADSVGDPSIPVTIVNHIGRCGSTMVMQILDEVPGLRAISEPYALLNTLQLYNKGSISQAQHDRLVASCLKLQCKLENTSVKQIVIKLAFPNMAQLPLIRTLMPSLRHILIFRDIQETTMSMWKVNQILLSSRASEQENREEWVYLLPFPPSVSKGSYPELILSGSLSLGAMVSLLIQATVRAARETVKTHGHFLEMFSYEQLLEDGASVERLLDLFALEDGGKVEVSGKWRKVDSQGTSLISRDNTKQQKTAGFPTLEEQEEIAAFLGIPSPTAGVEAVRRYILTGQ